jgi:hypothetical protein
MRRVALVPPLIALALGACAVIPPSGPSVMAIPAKGKSLADFQQDDLACRQFASQQIGYGSTGTSTPSPGADFYAAQAISIDLQQHYDTSYAQCITAKGNSITTSPVPYAYYYQYAPYGYPGYGSYYYPPYYYNPYYYRYP